MPESQRVSQGVEFNAERHEYKRDGVIYRSVTQVLASGGKCPWQYVDEELRESSAKRGTSVHWLTQLEDEYALNYRTVPKTLRGYRQAWMEWKRATGFVPVHIERQFISRYGYAGTFDRLGSFPITSLYGSRTTALVDLKTGEIQDYTRLQLAAYSLAVDERFQIARNIRRVAVRLKPDGTYRVFEWPRSTWDRDIAEFMECLHGGKRL